MEMINWWIDGDESDLVQAVKDAGYNCYNSRYACWELVSPHFLRGIELNFGLPIILSGSIQFNQIVRGMVGNNEVRLNLYPEVTTENYKCISYYPHYGDKLLNSNYTMLPFGDILRKKIDLFQKYGVDECIFIRPDSGLKEFTGNVIQYENFEKDLEHLSFYDVPKNLLVVVAEPQLISWEARMIVVNREVITGSYYRINRLHQESLIGQRHINSTQELIDNISWQPDDVYVIDVCETNGELKVVEVGALSYAGFYRCDRNKIVEKISNFIIGKEDNA